MPRHVTRSAHDLPRGMECGKAHVATDEATTNCSATDQLEYLYPLH
jgi:hypothetical protein